MPAGCSAGIRFPSGAVGTGIGAMTAVSEIAPYLWFDSQAEEADRLYDGLDAGGESQPCGWLKDRFGASWQIVPDALGRRLRGRDPNRVKRVIRVLLEIKED